MKNNTNTLCILKRLLLASSVTLAFGSCASSTAHQLTASHQLIQEKPERRFLTMAVPPAASTIEATRNRYRQLAAYLEKRTGKKIHIKAVPNYLEYWALVRSPGSYDLALDAAHFTDYRISRFGFRLLATQAGTASYSLLTLAKNAPGSLNRLAGRAIAVRSAPSMDSARLEAMFHDPSRQPRVLAINDYHDALDLLDNRTAVAAFLPTQMAFELSKPGTRYRIIAITEPVAAEAITASPRLDPVLHKQIQQALLLAPQDPMAVAALHSAGLGFFMPGLKQAYSGYSNYLSGVWGYNDHSQLVGG